MVGYKYDLVSGTWVPDPRQAHLRASDFTGDASRFGQRIIDGRTRIRACGSTMYVGTAQNPCPEKLSEHVLPFKVNEHHKARGGAFGAIVDACRSGRMSLDDIANPTLRRKVAAKL